MAPLGRPFMEDSRADFWAVKDERMRSPRVMKEAQSEEVRRWVV